MPPSTARSLGRLRKESNVTKEKFMNRLNSIRAGMGMLKRAAVLAFVTTVAACTAGGPSTTPTQQTTPNNNTTADYSGPAANNADVTSFQTAFWANVRATDRCGQCHSPSPTGKNQDPMFARSDDVNKAYDVANKLVNFSQPEMSTFVLKVAGGHNCWLADPKACGDTLTSWIKAWIGTSSGSTNGACSL